LHADTESNSSDESSISETTVDLLKVHHQQHHDAEVDEEDCSIDDSQLESCSVEIDSKNHGKNCKTKRRRHRKRRHRRKWHNHKNLYDVENHHWMMMEWTNQYVALDCEMVGTGPQGKISCLARVTVVDWFGNVILDTFVHPTEPVTDFRTNISGITFDDLYNHHQHHHHPFYDDDDEGEKSNEKEDREEHTILTIDECRQVVHSILDGKILIGHGLKNDLCCLGIDHPWELTRDTAKYEPLMKQNRYNGGFYPRKLRDLYYEHFHETIQCTSHSSYEDAIAALQLYQLVQVEWEKVMEYKIHKTDTIMNLRLG
jgi:RNA exonuclease 4